MSNNTLTSIEYYALSNNYFALNIKIQNELVDDNIQFSDVERASLVQQAAAAGRKAVYFQELGNNGLIKDVGTPVVNIKDAVEEAVQTIQNIKIAGKVIEVIADLVDIAVTIGLGASKPTAYTALPALVKELLKDVKALKNQ